jgi:hypothetical protein
MRCYVTNGCLDPTSKRCSGASFWLNWERHDMLPATQAGRADGPHRDDGAHAANPNECQVCARFRCLLGFEKEATGIVQHTAVAWPYRGDIACGDYGEAGTWWQLVPRRWWCCTGLGYESRATFALCHPSCDYRQDTTLFWNGFALPPTCGGHIDPSTLEPERILRGSPPPRTEATSAKVRRSCRPPLTWRQENSFGNRGTRFRTLARVPGTPLAAEGS